MKRLLVAGIAAAALLSMTLPAAAQQKMSANEDACWEGTLSHKIYTYKEIRDFAFQTGGLGVTPGDGHTQVLYVRSTLDWRVSATYRRVPCPPPAAQNPWGLGNVQSIDAAAQSLYGACSPEISGGGGWSSSRAHMAEQTGSGSGGAWDLAIGERCSYHDRWGTFRLDWTSYGKAESFQPPFEDLRVRPTDVLTPMIQIGPNFPGFAPGQVIAPFIEGGPSWGHIKVSTGLGSDTQWKLGYTVGGGADYRVNPNLLLRGEVKYTSFGTNTYQPSPGVFFNVNDHVWTTMISIVVQPWK